MEPLYKNKDLWFRKADYQDLDDLISLKNESWFGTHTITFANSISQKKWFESISEETHCPRNLLLIANTNTTSVGVFKIFGIDWQNRQAEVGWDVYKTHRGQGWGKKIVKLGVDFCFKVINLRRLNAQILETNEASLKCAIAAGFKQEGTQKQAIYKNNEYLDNLLFGILK